VEKELLPIAMNCGCSYELFWRLNPHKLQVFFEAKRKKTKEDVQMQDFFAWLLGTYVKDAFLSSINKNSSYPRSPRGLNQDDNFYYNQNQEDKDDESRSPNRNMSDGQRFALFMVKHNKVLEAKRAKQNQ
jgi:hypothetical protein